ncbi:imelysin family protein [uncultured Aquimarina sp.]|uniref:imelysin family protein n=1 Tax=uncultured Aquimarina sp. TaxID=575652 RepID=UPI0026204EBA|nr:imelysin family protein [uncultured Aquimarina sp.]
MKKIQIIFLVLIGCIISCNEDDPETNTNNFEVREFLDDVATNNILLSVNEFKNQTDALNLAVEVYLNDINETNLVTVRNQWKSTALAYASIYAFNIGEVRDRFFHQALYNWPTLPNAIESFIVDNTEINEELITSISPQAKTLSGLEYLVFKDSLGNTNQEFTLSDNRQNYLRFIALELKNQASRLLNVWEESGEDYASVFVNSQATAIDGSFNRLYNGLFNLIDTGKVTKIGKPAGLENSENTNPELTQAYFSNSSLEILRENIQSVERVYFKTNGLGISDYVFSVIKNNELNNAIKNKIDEIYESIDGIPVSLFEAITTNPNEVEVLHKKLDELGILFSVDVRSVLSIIITSTDNDGD